MVGLCSSVVGFARGKEGLAGHGTLSAKAVLLCTVGRTSWYFSTALYTAPLGRGAVPEGTWCGKVTIWERARGNLWLQGHILASLATLTATADQQRDGRWEIGEEEGLDSRKSFCLISVRAAPGPRRSQGRSTPAMRQKY